MREYVRDHEGLEHMVEAIDRILTFADGKAMDELEADNLKYYEQVAHYISDTDWEAWEKNEAVIVETTTTKNLEQTARRMRAKVFAVSDITDITGLSEDEIEKL